VSRCSFHRTDHRLSHPRSGSGRWLYVWYRWDRTHDALRSRGDSRKRGRILPVGRALTAEKLKHHGLDRGDDCAGRARYCQYHVHLSRHCDGISISLQMGSRSCGAHLCLPSGHVGAITRSCSPRCCASRSSPPRWLGQPRLLGPPCSSSCSCPRASWAASSPRRGRGRAARDVLAPYGSPRWPRAVPHRIPLPVALLRAAPTALSRASDLITVRLRE